MNRLKFWLFALIVIGLASAALRVLTGQLGDDGLAATDRQLRAAMARVEAAERSALNELAALAGVAAQDARLQAALRPSAPEPASPAVKPLKKAPPPPPPLSPTAEQLDSAANQAAAEAVTNALGGLGLSRGERVVLVATRDTLVRKPPTDADVVAFLDQAIQHKIRRGYAVLGGKLHAGAAVPVGDRGALAVFVPVDPAWLADKAGDDGAALVLAAPKARTIVLGAVESPDVLAQTAPRAVPARSGQLDRVELTPSWLPVHLPKVGPLLSARPAGRVLARSLPELSDGKMAVLVSARAALEPVVRLEWYSAAALALVLLLAIVFGLLIKPTEVAAALPPILLDAARKIEKGDFSVRAPVLAGKLGTLAAALNKAVDAAQSGAQTPVGSVTSEFFARAPEPGPEDPFSMPSRSARAAPSPESAPEPAPELGAADDDGARLDGANLTGAAFEAAPVAAPRPPAAAAAPAPARAPAPAPAVAAPEPVPAPAPAPRPAATVPAASAPELLAGAARAAAPDGDEEQHWREIFRDFVRTRAECGESAEGLTYEKFRQKLESNKSALVAKYGCKTVRFQVYVKDGKAALKATPVR